MNSGTLAAEVEGLRGADVEVEAKGAQVEQEQQPAHPAARVCIKLQAYDSTAPI